jgi:hypothetical protein
MTVHRLMVAILTLALAGAPVHGAAQSQPNRYQAIPDTSTPKSIWLFDTATASLSHCESNDPNKEPVCSPWSPVPAYSAMFKWDPAAGRLVPTNDAARSKAPLPSPTNEPDCSVRDEKGRPPIGCFFK